MRLLLSAVVIAMLPARAYADIEDNNIVIENYGTTNAKGGDAKGEIAWGLVSASKKGSGANAGGVDIRCAQGQSCSRNNIKITNMGTAEAAGDSVSSGVRLWNY